MKKVISLVAAVMTSLIVTIGASATALDNVQSGNNASQTTISQTAVPAPTQGQDNTVQNSNNEHADAVDNLMSMGIDKEAADKASEYTAPIVKWVNIILGVAAAVLGIILLVVTALDLIYIVSPSFIRNIGGGAAPAAPMSPMGGGAPAPAQASGFASLISDDCKAALAEAGAGDAAPAGGSPMGGMGGMGGFGGGGFGGGGFGGGFGGGMGGGFGAPAQQAAPPSKKAVAMVYLKKRVFTFVLVGICAVVLTCTCFLDVGTWLGAQIVNAVSGIGH